jgi:anti-sigma-K factor RskA
LALNAQDYINNGSVESYVLGLSSQDEAAAFEQACLDFPELMAARQAFEIALEEQALQSAVAPPAEWKNSILAAIQSENAVHHSPVSSAPIPSLSTVKGEDVNSLKREESNPTPKAVVKELNQGNPNKSSWLAAASVVLLIGSALANFYLYSENQRLQTQQNELLAQNQVLVSRVKATEQNLALITNPDVEPIIMKGVPSSPDSRATVYWNKNTSEVFLIANNLPKPNANQQYQLWAIVDGKPVDAGVFEVNEAGEMVNKMKSIPKSEAFAVTLEKRGGSASPTLEAMYVIGKV